MKKQLYEIDECGWHDQGFPFMPRVLAEKTAKQLNRAMQRTYRRRGKYKVSSTGLVTKDSSPRGLKEWYPHWNG